MSIRINLRRRWLLAPALALSAGLLLSACGSASSAPSHASLVKAACTKVNDALSDGPDPDVDPVGYAEAQIIPLSKIKVADGPLSKDIALVDVAYRQYFRTMGQQGTSVQLKNSLLRLRTFCPGVGS